MDNSCQILHTWASNLQRFSHGVVRKELPENGLYMVFERGETAHGVNRIVRVGTHTGDGNLGKRIFEHLYKPNKDRSIFRKHIGRCLLANDPFLEQWNIDLTKKATRIKYEHSIDFKKQKKIEEKVGAYIARNLSFVIIEIKEKSTRLAVEKALLSTIFTCNKCVPTKHWLGLKHQNPRIRKGLWNIQGLGGYPLSTEKMKNLIAEYAVTK